jgi:hypothetical protein
VLYVNDPAVNTKLTDGLIDPLGKDKATPLFVNVVQENVPKFDSVPVLLYVAAPEQVKAKPAKSIVPAVMVNVVHPPALAMVMVIPGKLYAIAPMDVPLNEYVALTCGVNVSVEYVPVADNVKLPAMFNAVVPGLKLVVPKVKFLNQLPVTMVATDAPVVNVKFGAFDVVPPAT